MKRIKYLPVLFLLLSLFFNTRQIKGQNKQVADLGLEMSIDNVQATVGSTVTFSIIVTNYGPTGATGVIVTDKLPNGYTFIIAATENGSYDSAAGIWNIGNLPKDKQVALSIKAGVNAGGNYMNLTEITRCDQDDPDSFTSNGVDTDKDDIVVDDPGDEDDGDGQDIKPILKEDEISSEKPIGIKAVLEDNKGNTATYFFDPNTIAMRVELDKKGKQPAMYFDNAGYVYTASKKQEYMKVPFEKLKKLMSFPTIVSGGLLPPLDFPDGSIKYYGMDVSPKKFPILEWAFVYKVIHFEGKAEFEKHIIECRGKANCIKYTLLSGPDAGSFVLFDSENRLAEIYSIKSGNAVYTYEDNTVTLPNAKEMPFMSDMF